MRKLKGSEAWKQTREFFTFYEIWLVHGCGSEYMNMIEYNVTVKENNVCKSLETKQSQRPKHEYCDARTDLSSSPNTLRATLGERTHVEKCKGQTLGEKQNTNLAQFCKRIRNTTYEKPTIPSWPCIGDIFSNDLSHWPS